MIVSKARDGPNHKSSIINHKSKSSPDCHVVVTEMKLCDDCGRDMQTGVKPRILVVDDEPEAVELVEFNLKQAGYAVITAADGAEALKKARAQHAGFDRARRDAAGNGRF